VRKREILRKNKKIKKELTVKIQPQAVKKGTVGANVQILNVLFLILQLFLFHVSINKLR
jgi:hypothetical protein